MTCSNRQIFIGPLGVADFLYNLITRYGVAKIVMSDQSQEFVNRVYEELFKLCGTDHRISAVYHPYSLTSSTTTKMTGMRVEGLNVITVLNVMKS